MIAKAYAFSAAPIMLLSTVTKLAISTVKYKYILADSEIENNLIENVIKVAKEKAISVDIDFEFVEPESEKNISAL